MLPTIQGTGVIVTPMMYGSADALRVSQKALPTEGTWGLCAWPYGDSRNGIWLGSIYTQGNSALANTNPDIDYEAHPSGAWSYLDQNGNYTFSLPDGSSVQFGSAPSITRNIVNEAQQTVSIPYPNNTRMSGSPTPFPFSFSLASGTTVSVDTSGNVTINLAASGTLNITEGGAASDFLVLASKMVTQFNAHTHGGGPTPTTPITSTEIKSTLIGIQE
jgi:hypothetical protein